MVDDRPTQDSHYAQFRETFATHIISAPVQAKLGSAPLQGMVYQNIVMIFMPIVLFGIARAKSVN